MSQGIKLAKNRQDIARATSDEFYLNTDTPLFKLFKSGQGSQSFIGAVGEVYDLYVYHNLGYVPFFILFADRIPGGQRRISTNTDNNIDNAQVAVLTDMDTQKLHINIGAPFHTTTGVFGYNYFIFYDRIN